MAKTRDLTNREIECLNWLARGLRSDQIADTLGISSSTVDFHLTNARRKLLATTREQAVAIAVGRKIVSLPVDPTSS